MSSPRSPFDDATLDRLPGGDLVRQGLLDLDSGIDDSVEALLVQIGWPRLRQLGFDVPKAEGIPEHRLYALLEPENPMSAHGRYNALIRRLVSFERAACVLTRTANA